MRCAADTYSIRFDRIPSARHLDEAGGVSKAMEFGRCRMVVGGDGGAFLMMGVDVVWMEL
jgi:hypothetical protein